MSDLGKLLENNRRWADGIKTDDPEYFLRLSRQQRPDILWIGCADSRVPANQIIDLPPGEVFVHRNIANVIVPTDLNCLSVLQFAVQVLEVSDVIIVGHYGCGGIAAALEDADHGLIDNWLEHIKDVRRRHADELESLEGEARQDRLVELNVMTGVDRVCATTIVKKAWRQGQNLTVHGWVYSLKDGLVKPLGSRKAGQPPALTSF
ncbi:MULTISPECIES: carbonate dehydratase [Euryhalocaulis]|uniref:carbonate dehydratase n=1 Tax=Euryhalocaulis TaxID=1712422 RepID=UPI0003A29C09|nr:MULTISPECIES: carbonate dehydratase [Euryhalocaulis]MBA4802221.1 carbonate dehydratase [Euryhalocaulis sp.]